jgi:hypothetical protein
MSENAKVLSLQKVAEKYKSMLLSKANVTGVAVGYKKVGGQLTGELSVVVFVRKKLPLSELRARDVIPPMLEGYRTDVVEAEFTALSQPSRTSRIRPAIGGISVGHYMITAGTITNIFYDYTKAEDETMPLVLVSNNHVIANCDLGRVGDPITQPGPFDGGVVPDDVIATLERWHPLTPGTRLIDGAVGTPVSQSDVSVEHYDFGVPKTPPAKPSLGMHILKGGRTTGLTEAIITYIDATLFVGYPQGTIPFAKQIIAEWNARWIGGGDSGSLAVEKDSKRCLGVCFAGTSDGKLGVMNNYTLFSSILKIGLPALLRIKVVDKDLKPVSAAVVTDENLGVALMTNASGEVWIGNYPIGTVARFTISHPDFATKSVEVSVQKQVQDVKFILEPKPPKVPSPLEMSVYSATYVGTLVGGFVVAQTILVPEIVTAFKEIKEVVK